MIYVGDIWFCISYLNNDNKLSIKLCMYYVYIVIVWILCYSCNLLRYFLSGIFAILNLWLLGRWCDDLDLWYSVDAFAIYLLVWQISYVVAQWCYHELLWPSFIFYQGSICIMSAIKSFLVYDLWLRYFPSITLVLFWIWSIYDM